MLPLPRDFLKVTELNAKAWNERYLTGNIPWDLSTPTPEFVRLLAENILPPPPGRVLVPGGGQGHDAILFAQHKYEVDLVDFAPKALEAALIQAATQKATIYAYRQNFFDLPASAFHQNAYDILLEYTFFCAISPELRGDYAKTAAALLKPGGYLVGLFFPLEIEKPGPPFKVSRKEVEELFRPYFELRIETPRRSVKPRAGREFLGLFTKK